MEIWRWSRFILRLRLPDEEGSSLKSSQAADNRQRKISSIRNGPGFFQWIIFCDYQAQKPCSSPFQVRCVNQVDALSKSGNELEGTIEEERLRKFLAPCLNK